MMLPHNGSIMSDQTSWIHPVARLRAARGWSQAELARRTGIPRTTLSAIEGERLTPAVSTALALAKGLESSVEELFGGGSPAPNPHRTDWALPPQSETCRYWEAEVGGRRRLYPVELLSPDAHDGVWLKGVARDSGRSSDRPTLVVATCDPAAGLLASEYAAATGNRMLVFQRGGAAALELLRSGAVHLAGIHRSTTDQPNRNVETVRTELGSGYQMIRVVHWEEGIALPRGDSRSSTRSVLKSTGCWALREAGSAARECLDELTGEPGSTLPGRTVCGHVAVAAAVRDGWAGAGVCVRLAAEEAQLHFLSVRTEHLDFCFPDSLARDARLLGLFRVLRSRSYRRLIGELPGCDAHHTGESTSI